MKPHRRRVLLWVALIAWTVTMFLLSCQAATDSDRVSLGIVGEILRLFPLLRRFGLDELRINAILRKAAHFTEFAVEGALIGCAAARLRNRQRAMLLSLLICAALAVTNELVQMLAEGRSCEARDMLIDFGGALLGLTAQGVIQRLCNKKRNILE